MRPISRKPGFKALLLFAALTCAGCHQGVKVPYIGWKTIYPQPHIKHSLFRRTAAIPDRYPLGSVNRAHYHTMETNAEASDFIVHRNEFIGATAELTSAGRDHILEIGARMRSTPFPVLIERSDNNMDPELDQHRRQIIAQVLTDLGNHDALQRTIVAPAYNRGLNSREGEADYYQFIHDRGFNNNNNYGNNSGNNFAGGTGFGF